MDMQGDDYPNQDVRWDDESRIENREKGFERNKLYNPSNAKIIFITTKINNDEIFTSDVNYRTRDAHSKMLFILIAVKSKLMFILSIWLIVGFIWMTLYVL